MPDSRPARSAAAHFATSDSLSAYWRFYWAVADAQLARWLPEEPGRILDLSGPDFRGAPRAVADGHDVVTLLPSAELRPRRQLTLVNGHVPAARRRSPGRLQPVVGDTTFLSEFTSGAFDGVLADNRVLSRHLATEASLGEIARVLRPGGRVLLCVDSVVLGMALLAEQDCWPELSFAPRADVLLVPWPDGSITRCFTAEQIGEVVTDVGLELDWIRPRTVLSASTVEVMLARDSQALGRLVEMELRAGESDDYVGVHLLASARKPNMITPPQPR
ncbi:class I SAM-dependent methyltransferase [Streptomonospora wellingtoniae]|uniref:Methyltransferase domain-containing protein n=1 Tax=Streptomonospora wellingtoniae TaxID=3075544 RepID=A0ABU2KQH9_9ACTN|nr:methyltransferase domain-containing protein [Streptomonospora sp. DSM 45055]MDT0301530.1 methyltransferase domain-containing protein [Streptomonospora sp. DSM 45055]